MERERSVGDEGMRTSARRRVKREVLVFPGAVDITVGRESQERWRRFAMRGRDVKGRVDSYEYMHSQQLDKNIMMYLAGQDEHLQIL
jgi:hypothetical protein